MCVREQSRKQNTPLNDHTSLKTECCFLFTSPLIRYFGLNKPNVV